MIDEAVSEFLGDLPLQGLDFRVDELDDLSGLNVDQVVVMRLRHGFIARSAIPEIMPVEYPGFFEQPHCPVDCSD